MRSTLLMALLALATPAHSAESMLICDVGGPGDQAQAQAVLDRFLRHAETSAGLPAATLKGQYFTDAAACAAAWKTEEPALVVLDLASWLAHAEAWSLRPIGRMGGPEARRYFLLAAEGRDLAALAGGKVFARLADRRFASRVVFGGQVDVSTHFGAWEDPRKPLRGVRRVMRGKADAALVDAVTRKQAGDLKLVPPLVEVHQSPGLPGLILGAVANRAPEVARKLEGALPKLCEGEGAELCATLVIDRVEPPDAARLKTLGAAYNAP